MEIIKIGLLIGFIATLPSILDWSQSTHMKIQYQKHVHCSKTKQNSLSKVIDNTCYIKGPNGWEPFELENFNIDISKL